MTDVAALVEDLRRPWRHGEHVDARDVTLEDRLVLDGLDVRGFDLSGARLNGGFSAKGTRFQGLAWLRGAEISGLCDFREAEFRIDLRADALRANDLVLDRSSVLGVLSLAGARLEGVSMRDALVMANVTMENAEIRTGVDMTGAEIMGGLWTARAEIASLNDCEAMVSGRIRLPG